MSIFETVVCGVDGSVEGLDAVRQASRLASDRLVLVSVVDTWDLVIGGGELPGPDPDSWVPRSRDALHGDAEAALAQAEAAVEGSCDVTSRLVEGSPFRALETEVLRCCATLLAVGTHGRSRTAGIVLGSVATSAVHHAPCSVLVARATKVSGAFPAAITVGVDGSVESALAFRSACEVRDRFGAKLTMVAGDAGRGMDLAAIKEQIAPEPLEVDERGTLDALVAASESVDLLVVGSRGLKGIPALGSVSERVAHRAVSSVLVVREPTVERYPRGERIPVEDVMSRPAVTVDADATIEEAARTMIEHGVGAVPVVGADGRVCGILAESDFAGREVVLSESRYGAQTRVPKLLGTLMVGDRLEPILEAAAKRSVREVMSAPVLAAVEGEPVQQALERMLHHEVGHLPVVRRGVPVGMLAHHDLLLLAARLWGSSEGDEQAGAAVE